MTSASLGKETKRKINLVPGLVVSVADHETRINKVETFLFTGNVEENSPSLAERQRTIEAKLSSVETWLKVVATAIILQVISGVFERLIP